MAVLLFMAVWFQTAAHTVAYHSNNALCGDDDCSGSTVCSCICHSPILPEIETYVCVGLQQTVWAPPSDETILALLLPADIFRPPLTNS